MSRGILLILLLPVPEIILFSYTIFNTDCPDSDTATITVMPVPEIYINSVGTLFVSSPPVTLNATPANGIFSGNGVTGNIFDPAEAGLGTHVVQYATTPDRYGCMSTDTIHISVLQTPSNHCRFRTGYGWMFPACQSGLSTGAHYGESYLWDFDDGQYSSEENPVHTYYVPGNYLVSLNCQE